MDGFGVVPSVLKNLRCDMEELKPCIRCKSVNVETVGCCIGWRVECADCELLGPLSSTQEGAIAIWNRRADEGESND